MRAYIWLIITALIVAAGAADSQAQSKESSKTIVIGCLERGAQGGYALKDFRNGVPYRLEGSAEMLDWHVGHYLEVYGVLQGGSADTLKVESVLYLSTTCPAPSK